MLISRHSSYQSEGINWRVVDGPDIVKDLHLKTLLGASQALRQRGSESPVTGWLARVCTDLGWAIGEIWSYTGRFFRLEYTWYHPRFPELAEFSALSRRLNPPFERTTMGEACALDQPVYVTNFPECSRYRGPIAGQFGLHTCLAMPIRTTEDSVFGLVLLDHGPRSEINAMIIALEVACNELGLYLSLQELERSRASAAPRASLSRLTNDLSFDAANHTLRGPAGTIRLSGIEWDVFSYLAQHRGSVVGHTNLMQTIWGVIDTNSRNSLYEIMSRLRAHLMSIGVDRRTLQVVPKQGYALHFDPEADLAESAGGA